MRRSIAAATLATLAIVAALGACGDDDAASNTRPLRLVAYDSFPTEGSDANAALGTFSDETGIEVELVIAGDTGGMVSKAVLTTGNPEGDVIFGIDDTFLAVAVDGEVFDGEPERVSFGDVCVNYDIAWFADREIPVPQSLDALAEPTYRNLLVVENPVTSAPGMSFLLATIDEFGDAGWQQYWTALRDNGVTVVDSWTTAYYEQFSASGGDRPMVVSYGSSPPADVVFADPPRDTPATAVIESTCYRADEWAGVLRGTDRGDDARRLLTFLTERRFQETLPLSLFVYPANEDAELPDVFQRFAIVPTDPHRIAPPTVAERRREWQDEWTELVLR
jgi:thiamine transport system substrate-binding protein